jgi:hypothetical protein
MGYQGKEENVLQSQEFAPWLDSYNLDVIMLISKVLNKGS